MTADPLQARAHSLIATGEIDRAGQDARAMKALAERSGTAGLASRAWATLSRVQMRSGQAPKALESAERALQADTGSRRQRAEARLTLASIQARLNRSEAALASASRPAASRKFCWFRSSWATACTPSARPRFASSPSAANSASAARALAIARRHGDRLGEGAALNILYRQHADLAQRLHGL